MFDIFGNLLVVGDTVACMEKNYRNLVIGKIIKITAQKVKVEYTNSHGYQHIYLTEPKSVVKKG